MNLENKEVQKLKLEKKCFFHKNWSPKLKFFNFFLKKFSRFLTLKIDYESKMVALFEKT